MASVLAVRRLGGAMSISPARYRAIAIWALVALAVIIVSGAAVRLTNSGLGCDDWPQCNSEQLIDVSSKHAAIEQLNRLFTGVVAIAVIAAVLGRGEARAAPRRPHGAVVVARVRRARERGHRRHLGEGRPAPDVDPEPPAAVDVPHRDGHRARASGRRTRRCRDASGWSIRSPNAWSGRTSRSAVSRCSQARSSPVRARTPATRRPSGCRSRSRQRRGSTASR